MRVFIILAAFGFNIFALPARSQVAVPAPAARDAALIQRIQAFHFGQDPGLAGAVTQWVNQVRSNPARRKETARELSAVLGTDAAFDAKQLACRNLALIATGDQVPALLGLLSDDHLAHYALMVLAHIPGEIVNRPLRARLGSLHGDAQLEATDLLGERRDTRAIPLLAAQLNSTDSALAGATAAALAKIGDPRALDVLQLAYGRSSGLRRAFLDDALLNAAARGFDPRNPTPSLRVYVLLDHSAASPIVRAAALRGMVETGGPAAWPLVIRALAEENTPRQRMAAALAREIPGKQATLLLARTLSGLPAHTQSLLLEALADRGDAAAAPAVMALARSSDARVREDALTALGALGDDSAVPLLLQAAANPEAQSAARASLARLRGKMVDTRLIEALDAGSPATRIEAIQALGQRHVTAAAPRLVQTARSTEHQVRDAALRVLRDLGRPMDLQALVNLLLASPAGNRDAVMETIAEIARRGADENERTGILLRSLSAASRAGDRADLLNLLAQVGGAPALAALRQAASDPAPEVRLEALKGLTGWPTPDPMDDLFQIVQKTNDPTERTLALQGYLRMVSLDDQRPADQALALYRKAGALLRSPGEKRVLLAGLSRLQTLGALQYASGFVSDAAVRPEAESAVIAIGRGTIGAWRDQTTAVITPIAANSPDQDTRKRAQDVLALANHFGDYVMAWEYSPAYQKAGADYRQLFDLPFPPEEPGQEANVPWRTLPVGTNPDQPWLLDLLTALGGEQRVAYLRTSVWSDTARDLVLELGSDDGVKAWWNGQVILADNTARAVAPGQEKVTVSAKPGWNRLMLKITQNNQGWGAVARFTNPDGSPAAGLRYGLQSEVRATGA